EHSSSVYNLNGSKQLDVGDTTWFRQLKGQLVAAARVITLARFKVRDNANDELSRSNGKCQISIDRNGSLYAVERRSRRRLCLREDLDLDPKSMDGNDVANNARVFHAHALSSLLPFCPVSGAICFSKRRMRRKSSSQRTSGMMERAKSSKVAYLNSASLNAASVGVRTKARLPRSL